MADVADAEQQGADGEAPEGKSKKKRLMILAVAGLVLLVGIGGGAAYFMGWLSSSAGGPGQPPVVESYYFDLPEMVININALDQRTQYLKIKATLEVRDKATFKAIEPHLPKILDSFQVYLRELRVTDIEGSGGLYRLKEELLRRINTAVYPSEVSAVLFREIIVQ